MPQHVTQRDPFAELGWRDIYQGYTNQMSGLDSPSAYGHVIRQGLANNPLLRTAQTQFLVQGDYSVLDNDPELGDYHVSGVLQGYQGKDRGDRNPYWDFLDTYVPMKGQELINTIDDVILNINAPAGSIVGSDVSPEDYNDMQRRQLMWRETFGISGNASQAQEQLVALPVLEHTSPAFKNEMVGILSTLRSNWLVDPDRPKGETWLEYAREKDFFGLVPKNLLGQ